MVKTKPKRLHHYVKFTFWVLLVQLLLINVSAALYAYKFTHFYNPPLPPPASKNILQKTWTLFTGPKIYKMPPADTAVFSFQQKTFLTNNNILIDAWYAKTDTAKACVIFVHGYTANKTSLLPEATRFHNMGFNVLLFDLRGHGKSGGNSSFGMKETDELEKAIVFAGMQGNKQIILYGASMGADIVLKAVSEKKIQPRAIILDMPYASLHHHYQARARVIGFPAQPFAFFVTLWTGIENGYNGFSNNAINFASKVTCPVLLQWGKEDEFVKKEEVDSIFNALQSANKKLVVYEDAGHHALAAVVPEQWQREVNMFMKSLR